MRQDQPSDQDSSAKPSPEGGTPEQGDRPGEPQGGANQEGASSGPPTGGGLPSGQQASRAEEELDVPEGDAANLDYARRVTDLVLDRLRQQQDEPDPRLLEDLGWSEEDLQKFLNRWQRLKQAAREDRSGQRELDETLRSLGLRPMRDRRRQGGQRDDQLRGLRDSGLRSSPPSQYLEQFEAFKKGTAGGRTQDEG
jgi:hypothetical protein